MYKQDNGGGESLLDQRKELLEELINSDIIDEEHGYYDDVKGAIESNNSEQMREIIDELLSSGFIYKDDWDYKLARKLSKEGKKFDLGGGVDDSDDYGTFEIYKNGGSIEVNVVNSDKKYNEKEYDWILGDKDKDGVANADDVNPLDKKKNELIDTPSITTGIKSLISLKKSLDSTMFSFIDDLKNVAPDNSKIYARTKTPYSVLDKLIKKRLSTITDLIGTTIVTSDKKELDSVKKYIDSGKLGKIIELEDMYKNPKGGYRAYHYLIERNGMSIELQLKTKRQKALNELSHEPYKLGKINSALLLKITEIANRADEGDNGAIKEYNEFMKTPNIENVFYAEKMSTGGGVGNYKEKNETMDKMGKYRTGGSIEQEVPLRADINGDMYEVIGVNHKLNKVRAKNFSSGKVIEMPIDNWYKESFEFGTKAKFKANGREYIGMVTMKDGQKSISLFNDEDYSGDAERIVPFNKIDLKTLKPTMEREKFAVGGEVGNQVSFKGDYGTPRSGIVKEKRGSSYIVATDNGDRLVNSYEVISFSDAPMEKKKRFGFFEGGGEIEGRISDLQAVVDGDFPQFAKDKAKAEIEKLKKELQESKETIPKLIEASKKLETKKGFEDVEPFVYEVTKKGAKKSLGDKVESVDINLMDLEKGELKKPTTKKAPVKKATYDLKSDDGKIDRGNISETKLTKSSKPKADHKKLLAKIKAKKGDKEYDNKASLNPETGERRKRSESSDKKREALPLGKRVSADGSVYYENRLNRGDISKEDKFKTGGEIMEKNKEWNLTVRFKNGSSYSYYGDTKKEALDKYKKAFGDFKGVTNKEWELVDKFEGGGEISENNSGWGLKFLKW